MSVSKDERDDWLTVCFKYLLFVFNFLFWVGGAAVLAVGVWTLVEKSDYLSLLASGTFAASACILVVAGSLVVVTGFLGCCAVIREQRSWLSLYFFCLLLIFLIELVAGVLAYVYYQKVSEELKQHLNLTMTENYAQPGKEDITLAVDRLQQDFKCCGSNNSGDWAASRFVTSGQAAGRVVPDSCCKTITLMCGRRNHPSNIYRVEGGCISKLEQFLADHLLVIGAVGIGVACLQKRRKTLAPFDLARQQRCGLINQNQVGEVGLRYELRAANAIRERLHVPLCVGGSAACFCSARCDDGLSIADKVVTESSMLVNTHISCSSAAFSMSFLSFPPE